jgi:hypothetical protein
LFDYFDKLIECEWHLSLVKVLDLSHNASHWVVAPDVPNHIKVEQATITFELFVNELHLFLDFFIFLPLHIELSFVFIHGDTSVLILGVNKFSHGLESIKILVGLGFLSGLSLPVQVAV